MTATPTVTTYEPFSERPEYRTMNRDFVAGLCLGPESRVLDLACGAGIVSEEILRRCPDARVAALDISPESLDLARRRLARWGRGRVTYVEASADRVPLPDRSFDLVVMGNSIHNLPDVRELLREVHRLLDDQGRFVFTTSFYAGTFEEGTERFYLRWVKEALARVALEDRRLREAGRPGLPRIRGTTPRSASRPWVSPDGYRDLLEDEGFLVLSSEERVIRLTRQSFEAVGSYAGLAEVLLSGYPVEVACRALGEAVAAALEATGFEQVPRRWLEMEALRC